MARGGVRCEVEPRASKAKKPKEDDAQKQRRDVKVRAQRAIDRRVSKSNQAKAATRVDAQGRSLEARVTDDLIEKEAQSKKHVRFCNAYWVDIFAEYGLEAESSSLEEPDDFDEDDVDADLSEAVGLLHAKNPVERRPDGIEAFLSSCGSLSRVDAYLLYSAIPEGAEVTRAASDACFLAVTEYNVRTGDHLKHADYWEVSKGCAEQSVIRHFDEIGSKMRFTTYLRTKRPILGLFFELRLLDEIIATNGKWSEAPEAILECKLSCDLGCTLFGAISELVIYDVYCARVRNLAKVMIAESFSDGAVQDFKDQAFALCTSMLLSGKKRFVGRDAKIPFVCNKVLDFKMTDPHLYWKLILASTRKVYGLGTQLPFLSYEPHIITAGPASRIGPDIAVRSYVDAREECNEYLKTCRSFEQMKLKIIKYRKVLLDIDETFILEIEFVKQFAGKLLDDKLRDVALDAFPSEPLST
eukprot:TRINITY_DN39666_c0_g1_i1.p1 TRINITY_DN39666_c0_g1~~TRINITY_DN39666_c0_g1_i1.p1  ORF type:complete len:493 (-),score=95.45 TRINITY_DN39666_c0_g1_i1:941-2350(-)